MYELLNLPEAPRVVYRDAPLALAVVELRFPPVLDLLSPEVLGRFHRSIRDRYPLSARTEEVQLEIELEGQAVPRSRRLPQKIQFVDQAQDWTVAVGEGSLALESRAYVHFEDFQDRFHHLLDSLDPLIRPSLLLRLGLRYIDEFRPLHDGPAAVILPTHLGMLGPGPFQRLVTTCVQQANLTVDPVTKVTIRHGMLPSGSVLRPPKLPDVRLQEPFYLLDVDVFAEFQPSEAPTLQWETVGSLLNDYHEAQHRLFHWFMQPSFEQNLAREDR